MSLDQSAHPEWQWDGSLSEDEIRDHLGLSPLDDPTAPTESGGGSA